MCNMAAWPKNENALADRTLLLIARNSRSPASTHPPQILGADFSLGVTCDTLYVYSQNNSEWNQAIKPAPISIENLKSALLKLTPLLKQFTVDNTPTNLVNLVKSSDSRFSLEQIPPELLKGTFEICRKISWTLQQLNSAMSEKAPSKTLGNILV